MNPSKIIKYLKITLGAENQADLAEKLGFDETRVKNLESGRVKKFKDEEIDLLVQKTTLTRPQILLGDVPMLVNLSEITNPSEYLRNIHLDAGSANKFVDDILNYDPKRKDGEAVTRKEIESALDNDSEQVLLNFYPNTHTAAGYGAVNNDDMPEKLMVPADFLRSMFKLDSLVGLDVIHVTGDSMEPIVKHGDAIIVQKTAEARNNQIVIARIHDEYYVKRLVKDPINKKVRLTSENDYYPDMDISGGQLAELEIVGVVVGKYKPF